MMKEVTLFSLTCDRCGWQEYVKMGDDPFCEDRWIRREDLHFCEWKCAYWGDNN